MLSYEQATYWLTRVQEYVEFIKKIWFILRHILWLCTKCICIYADTEKMNKLWLFPFVTKKNRVLFLVEIDGQKTKCAQILTESMILRKAAQPNALNWYYFFFFGFHQVTAKKKQLIFKKKKKHNAPKLRSLRWFFRLKNLRFFLDTPTALHGKFSGLMQNHQATIKKKKAIGFCFAAHKTHALLVHKTLKFYHHELNHQSKCCLILLAVLKLTFPI